MVRSLSADSSKVILSVHAEERMEERGVTWPQVLSVLRKGHASKRPNLDREHNSWECLMSNTTAGEMISVKVAILQNQELIVITVF